MFDDDAADVFGFGYGQQQFGGDPAAPAMAGGGNDRREQLGLVMASLAGLFSPDGRNPAMQNIQMLQQMRGQQQKNAYMQQMLELKRRQAEAKERAEAAYANGMGEIFNGAGDAQQPQPPAGAAPMNNLPDPGAGEWGPSPEGPAAQAPGGMPGGVPAGPDPVVQRRINTYRRAADLAARTGRGEDAKRYADIADGMERSSQEEWSPPVVELVAGKPTLVQYGKRGGRRVVDGADPRRNLTAPVASADGMISLDQDSGQVERLGVGAHEPTPNDVREYQFAVKQGYKGTFEQWASTMANLKAPKTTLQPTIINKIGQAYGEKVAEGVATNNVKAVEAAAVAHQGMQTLDRIDGVLGEAITGPFAGARAFGARVLSQIPGAPKQFNEKLKATATTLQGLASLSLDGAKALEGQGQVTEFERKLVEKAASAPLEMTEVELRAVTAVLRKVKTVQVQRGLAAAQSIKTDPNLASVVPHVNSMIDGVQMPSAVPTTPGRESSGKVTEPGQRTVVRTGKTKDGRRVVEYSDGTREYR